MKMKKSTAVSLAEDLVSYLCKKNSSEKFYGFNISFALDLVPIREITTSEKFQGIVVPHSLTSKIVTRGGRKEREVRIDIGLLCTSREDTLEYLISAAQAVGDSIEGIRLGDAFCTGVEYSPLYSADDWSRQHSFISVLLVTFKVFE